MHKHEYRQTHSHVHTYLCGRAQLQTSIFKYTHTLQAHALTSRNLVYATSLGQLFYLVKGDSAWLYCCPRLKSVFMSCLVASSGHQELYEWELKGKGLILSGWLSFKPLERQGSLQQRTHLPFSSFLVAPMIQKLSLNTSFVQKCIFP